MIRIAASIVGISVELHRTSQLLNKNGQFINLNNYAHSAMYSIFLIYSVVEILKFYNVIKLPNCSEHIFAATAFAIEGILFLFHLDGRPKLDQLLHTFLYTVVFATALVLVVESFKENSFLLLFVRTFLVLLQGTWFFQIAHCLYGKVKWENTKPNQEFVIVAFSWHVICILVFTVIGFVVISIKARGCKHCKETNFTNTSETDFVLGSRGDTDIEPLIMDAGEENGDHFA